MKLQGVSLMLAVMTLFIASPAMSQESTYKFDLGASVGMSGYLGDANNANLFANTGFSAAANFRYLINTRWAVRGSLMTAGLSGNSADMENLFPGGETYKFTSTVYDLGGRIEFNFFNYGIGESYRKMKRWSPYMSLGIGMTVASSSGTHIYANIPMGLGVKYKLKPRINLGLEWTMTKVLGDKVDGEILDDPYHIKSSFIKNTDWYSTIMLSISYEFGERCKNCFYVD